MRDTGGPEGEESFPELVSRAVDDAKEVARAEIALVRAQAAARVAQYRAAALLFAAAGTLCIAAAVAGTVGLVLTLGPRIGYGWATLLVVAAFLLVAAVLGRLGVTRFKQKWVDRE